jgi:hypothetical protein
MQLSGGTGGDQRPQIEDAVPTPHTSGGPTVGASRGGRPGSPVGRRGAGTPAAPSVDSIDAALFLVRAEEEERPTGLHYWAYVRGK